MDDRRMSVEITQETIFKSAIIKSLKKHLNHASTLDGREITYAPNWKEWAGFIGINTTSTIINSGIIAGAVTSGVISAAIAPAIIIPIAIAGFASYAGFVTYRLQTKRKEYQTVSILFENRNIDDDINGIADNLYELYEENIDTLSNESNRKFADILANTICYALMKNKIKTIDALLDGCQLHHLLISLSKNIPKETLRTLPDNDKLNARGYITKSAIHCKESNTTYIHDKTRIDKYGLTSLDNNKELKKFRKLSVKTDYLPLDSSDTKYFLNNSIFSSPNTPLNDLELTEDPCFSREKDYNVSNIKN